MKPNSLVSRMPILADGQALSRENLIISADIVPSVHRRSGLLMVAPLEHDLVACHAGHQSFSLQVECETCLQAMILTASC